MWPIIAIASFICLLVNVAYIRDTLDVKDDTALVSFHLSMTAVNIYTLFTSVSKVVGV